MESGWMDEWCEREKTIERHSIVSKEAQKTKKKDRNGEEQLKRY